MNGTGDSVQFHPHPILSHLSPLSSTPPAANPLTQPWQFPMNHTVRVWEWEPQRQGQRWARGKSTMKQTANYVLGLQWKCNGNTSRPLACLLSRGLLRLSNRSMFVCVHLSCSCLWRTERWSGTESAGRSWRDACWTPVSGPQTGSASGQRGGLRSELVLDCVNVDLMILTASFCDNDILVRARIRNLVTTRLCR